MPAVATKVKVCKRQIHNGTERVPCNTPYIGENCTQKNKHVLKIKTGYCNIGSCEGTKPKSHKGSPMPTCEYWQTCACKCHAQLDQMFKSIEEERILISNPEYVPDIIPFSVFDYIESTESSAALGPDGVNLPEGVERPVTGKPARNPAMLAGTRTETGRAARGGLEAQVWNMCKMFSDKGVADLVTPKILAEAIANEYKIPTPSTGAIGAVFDRWSKLGFAKQEKKPVRFVGFTGEGTWEELQVMKARIKRQAKQAQSAARRGFR